MGGKVLLIDHPVGKRDDRASQLLAARGYALDWRCPGNGESLPEPGPEHCAAVVYGGPESANDVESKAYIRQETDWIGRWIAAERPFLGICLGAQMLARVLGAPVSRHPEGLYEIGYVPIASTAAGNGFLPEPLHVFHWHKEGFEVPEGAELLATGPTFPNQAFRYGRRAYGIQFHPEVTGAVMNRWIDEASHMLAEPGAHDAGRQRSDARRFDRPMSLWLDTFLDQWLGDTRSSTRCGAGKGGTPR